MMLCWKSQVVEKEDPAPDVRKYSGAQRHVTVVPTYLLLVFNINKLGLMGLTKRSFWFCLCLY